MADPKWIHSFLVLCPYFSSLEECRIMSFISLHIEEKVSNPGLQVIPHKQRDYLMLIDKLMRDTLD